MKRGRHAQADCLCAVVQRRGFLLRGSGWKCAFVRRTDMRTSDVESSTANLTETRVGPDHPAEQSLEERARREDPSLLKTLLEQMLLIRRFEEKAAETVHPGEDRRLLPSVHRPGGGGRGSASRRSARRLHPDVLPRARARPGAGHATPAGDGGAVREADAASRRARAGRCTCSTSAAGFLGGHAIVGGHIPLATGVAFAIKYLHQPASRSASSARRPSTSAPSTSR